jgi:transcriptional regulator with PAS, ATPase and Fis domain
MIAGDPLMRKLGALIERAAPTEATVLITGETGTGKELVARTIHALSPRANKTFVPINCAAIPQELLESELFGHARGAFTGALAPRPGLFQLAKGGTLLLDEVGELPLALQAKLLRVLQEREVRPIGADHAVPVDVRVIASTNKDLEEEVAKGAFRQDLFYRLQVIPIVVPPLRTRRSDIPLLVRYFLEKCNRRYGIAVEISTEAMVYLWEYDWPGNVRQLENIVEQLVILSSKDRIDVADLPATIVAPKMRADAPALPLLAAEGLDLQQTLEQLEFRLIEEALKLAKGKKSAAAELLRVKRTTLVAKLRRRKEAQAAPKPPRLYALPKDEEETQCTRSAPAPLRRAQ